jgi:MFS family permease
MASQIQNQQFGKKYFIFLLVYLAFYEIYDTYTTSFYPAIVSYITADYGITISEYYLGLSMASLGLYFVIVILFLADRIGRKPMLILVFFGMGFSSFLMGISQTFSQFTFSLFLLFIFFSSDLWVIMLSEVAPKEKRATYLYLISFIGTVGVFLIPYLRSTATNPAEPHTWVNMTYIVWVAMPIALLGIFIKESDVFLEKKAQRLNKWDWNSLRTQIIAPFIGESKRKSIAFIIIGFVIGINYNTLQTIEKFFSLYILDNDTISFIILIAGIGSLLVFGLTGLLADKFGRKKMMNLFSVGYFFSITCLVMFTVYGFSIGVYIFVVTSQIGFWGNFTLSKVYCAECFSTESRAYSVGWRSFAYALGMTLGALISSWLTKFMSLGLSYILNGLWVIIIIPVCVKYLLPETRGLEITKNESFE